MFAADISAVYSSAVCTAGMPAVYTADMSAIHTADISAAPTADKPAVCTADMSAVKMSQFGSPVRRESWEAETVGKLEHAGQDH